MFADLAALWQITHHALQSVHVITNLLESVFKEQLNLSTKIKKKLNTNSANLLKK